MKIISKEAINKMDKSNMYKGDKKIISTNVFQNKVMKKGSSLRPIEIPKGPSSIKNRKKAFNIIS